MKAPLSYSPRCRAASSPGDLGGVPRRVPGAGAAHVLHAVQRVADST